MVPQPQKFLKFFFLQSLLHVVHMHQVLQCSADSVGKFLWPSVESNLCFF